MEIKKVDIMQETNYLSVININRVCCLSKIVNGYDIAKRSLQKKEGGRGRYGVWARLSLLPAAWG